ncbi:zinc ribbon domain-containing protein [Aromatoleum toluclasticum]|uniref:zinc ribbon domain-containing protein n=1 Tax=Aromatoleum toluclasticum TaxID=92003 RepID=UPI001D18D640|nr:zinc ribbon domain-containing protein [Aromatoleum toluclasticum]MCC4115345.1 zinc ribbon domain-containing protein [Aromatoleum toluclasticum]
MTDDPQKRIIRIKVPVIIDEERFRRIAARRTSRSPRKTPPLHVTPRTLLTGLCRCGYCRSAMHIVTGKGGRYRYLKCNRRHTISGSICSSPNLPYERFEKLILRHVAEHVLTESRLQIILEDCRVHADLLSRTQRSERQQFADLKASIERKLKNLYKLVEEEKVRIDDSLRARITTWQDELTDITVKLDSVKVPVALPKDLVNRIDIKSFRSAVLAVLDEPGSDSAKAFMHLVVQEIRIYADEASVSGPNLGVLEAALTHQRSTASQVPSFMCNWRRVSQPR